MKNFAKTTAIFLLTNFIFSACAARVENAPPLAPIMPANENAPALTVQPSPDAAPPTPKIPNLQAEILDNRSKTTVSPLGTFDFKNYAYPLPRGWQDADGKDAVLENGKRLMSAEEKKIGLSFVTTKYFDVNGDNQDEAAVILKITTAGSAIPQIVYLFEWKDGAPKLIKYFRTGDRADGGLKDLRMENGLLTVEIYGQDRYLLGETETNKITGDEEQICCPTFYTRTAYKWTGSDFKMQGKRLTFPTGDAAAAPQENLGDIIERENSAKK